MSGTRSKRASARRTALGYIRQMKKNLETLTGWWDVRSTVFLSREDRVPGTDVFYRPRTQEEYPEVQRRFWASTVREIDEMTKQLEEFRTVAVAEYHKCAPPTGEDT